MSIWGCFLLRVIGVARLLSSVTETGLFNHELGLINLTIVSLSVLAPGTGRRQTEAEAATTQEAPLDLTGAGKLRQR